MFSVNKYTIKKISVQIGKKNERFIVDPAYISKKTNDNIRTNGKREKSITLFLFLSNGFAAVLIPKIIKKSPAIMQGFFFVSK